ncbi:MAG: DEAD/DEAH box helicase [bacterium]
MKTDEDGKGAPPDGPADGTADGPASFEGFGLRDELLRAVRKQGFTRPSPIQVAVVPAALAGRDVLGSAETGSGKTAAFVLPVLQHLMDGSGFRCLVLEPTRELAIQVKEVAATLGEFTGVKTVVVLGGVPQEYQIAKIRAGMDILVATPGRLIDFAWQGVVDFDLIKHLVVDEVDRMFDMGFVSDIEHIISFLPQRPYQKMFFSATLPPEVTKLLNPLLVNDPAKVIIGRRSKPAEGITHELYPVRKGDKTNALIRILRDSRVDSAIVFMETKSGADRLSRELKAEKIDASVLHSGFDQMRRGEILERFRKGRVRILVATNVAARGLDIAGISHIINYDVPQQAEDYVHRIGRSARADATGTAVTFASPGEARSLERIEKLVGMRLPRKQIEGLTATDVTDRRGGTAGAPHSGRPGGGRGPRRPAQRPGEKNTRRPPHKKD